MLFFAIPLRSRETTKNWENVCRVFRRTLDSAYAQTDGDFKVLVACHERPAFAGEYDERVEFLMSDQAVPRNQQEMLLDKGYKISMMGRRIREHGGGYVMILDADDLVSNRVAAFVNSQPECSGYVSRFGYIYYEGSRYMKMIRNPYRICGSCTIVHYREDELPDRLPESLLDRSHIDRWLIRTSHRILPEKLAKMGRPLQNLPFPSTVYLRNTGDNHSLLIGGDLNRKRRMELTFRRKIPIDSDIGREFGLGRK